jgi:hypothetical protein
MVTERNDLNPYCPPATPQGLAEHRRAEPANRTAVVGFVLTALGMFGFTLLTATVFLQLIPSGHGAKWIVHIGASVLTGAAWLGLALCLFGLLWRPRQMAVYGIAIFVAGTIVLSNFGMVLVMWLQADGPPFTGNHRIIPPSGSWQAPLPPNFEK